MGCGSSTQPSQIKYDPKWNKKPEEVPSVAAASQPSLSLKNVRPNHSTVLEPVVNSAGMLRDTGEESSENDRSPEDVILNDLFVYSDFSVNTNILSVPITSPRGRTMSRIARITGTLRLDPFAPGGVTLASLTIPLVIKHQIVKHHQKRNSAGLRFDFSDFQILLTENELNEEIISRAGSSFSNVQMKHLLEAKKNKVEKMYDFEVTTLLGRAARIKCVRLSPDERRLVACSHDEQILIMYNIATRKEVLQFEGHEDTVMCVCFSPDGKFLCSASRDETVILWDVSTAKQVHVLQHNAMVITCDYSPDGTTIATGCQDKIVRLWEARSGKELAALTEHTGLVICVAFAPDSHSLVSSSVDRTLVVWDVRTHKKRHILKGHQSVVLSCAYSPDNLRIVSNDEKYIRVWNARDGKLINTFSMDKSECNSRSSSRGSDRGSAPKPLITNNAAANLAKRQEQKYILCAYSPGAYIVASINNRTVQLLDPNTGEEVLSLQFKASSYCCSCGQFNTMVFGDANGNIHVVRLRLESDRLCLPASALKREAPEDISE